GTGAPRKVWDGTQGAASHNPGKPEPGRDGCPGSGGQGLGGGPARGRGGPGSPIVQTGDSTYLAGAGASPEGDRPFLDRLNVKTLQSERIFRSSAEALESFVAPLNAHATPFLTPRE